MCGCKKTSVYELLNTGMVGLRLTAVHQLVEYQPGQPFSWFLGEVAMPGVRQIKIL